MFERIVVAVDGSPQGGKTVPAAVELATRFGSAVTVVHVREHTKYEGEDVDLGPEQDAHQILDSAVEAFRAVGVTAEPVLRRVAPGHTPEEIVAAAKEQDAGLIVMGTRGMTELRSLVLGGVANKVVHHAHCPVLLVR